MGEMMDLWLAARLHIVVFAQKLKYNKIELITIAFTIQSKLI